MASSTHSDETRIAILDGWRALSILLVLFSHWVPTPRAWQLNDVAGASGMAIFFTLSGFLITRLLLNDSEILPFLIRRLMRIVPLAWAAVAILWIANRPDLDTTMANFLFYSNLPPARLMTGGHHLWSLCIEVQFYLGIALLVGIGGRRALLALPLIALAITVLRIADGETMERIFTSAPASYIARVSYAVYVVHGMLTATWLGGEQASRTTQYLLRPVLAAATFAVAHVSTFHYEKHWIQWGKRLAGRAGKGSASITNA